MITKLSYKLALASLLVSVTAQANANHSDTHKAYLQPTSSAVSTKRHFVQFFSTLNATKAEGMKNTLIKKGFPAFIHIYAQQKKSYYQVQIGPFPSKITAQQARNKVIQHYPEHRFLSSAILKSTI